MAVKPIKKKKADRTTPSTVCRVNKNGNYTVMSNFHLRSPNLSLKAVGLMSRVLSLPEGWDYSIAGLTAICREKESAIKSALAELKKWGYLVVSKLMPNQTKSGRIEYVYDFFEYSEKDVPQDEESADDDGDVSDDETYSEKSTSQEGRKQGIENLPLENQPVEIQTTENQGQLNTKEKIKKKEILFEQVSINQSSAGKEKTVGSDDGLTDGYLKEQQIYSDIVRANIDFPFFAEWLNDYDEAEEIVQMIVRQICSGKATERICGQDFPREVVKSAMLKVDIYILENAIMQMKCTDNIRNFESYLISTLFNEANGRHFKENAERRWAEYAVKRDMGVY